MTTAIIPHPIFFRQQLDPSPCIENEGPALDLLDRCRVHLSKGMHLDYVVNEARTDFPDRSTRAPQLDNAWMLDQRAARRCIAILENASFLSCKHRAELIWRIRGMHPLLEFAFY